MNRNGLYILLGALIVIIAGFAIYTYQQEKKPDGVELKIGDQGISIQKN